MLHDTIEDTRFTPHDIQKEFGKKTLELVEGVTKLNKFGNQSNDVAQASNLKKLLLAVSKDIRVLIVRLADRLHNMRTLSSIPSPEKRYRIALETMEIYAPLAERIGMQLMKNELQDIAFAELKPELSKSIGRRLDFLKTKGKDTVKFVLKVLNDLLRSYGSCAIITGREKTPYSIWKKVERKAVNFDAISDIFAFRIITSDIIECYRILGIVHSNYHVIANGFEDYISNPKTNGYQSLHTLVIGPDKKPIEIQIRTKQMHEVAEIGIASHWAYKQGETPDMSSITQYKWLHKVISVLENSSSAEDVLENAKLEMYYEQVFCFTPKGHIMALPKGATPIDFAFAVHSDVGLTCIGARINGTISSLNTILENGDQIEILRSDFPSVLPSWYHSAVTGKAKSKIKKFFSNIQKEEFIRSGKILLNNALLSIDKSLNPDDMLDIATRAYGKTTDSLLLSIGDGRTNPKAIAHTIFPNKVNRLTQKLNPVSFIKRSKKQNQTNQMVTVDGAVDGITFHLSKCCYPLPGEKIVGIISSDDKTMMHIHTVGCHSLHNADDNRMIELCWKGGNANGFYTTQIYLSIINESGTLSTATKIISDFGVNILDIKTAGRSLRSFDVLLELEVKGVQQVHTLISALKISDSIHTAYRASDNDHSGLKMIGDWHN